MPKQEFKIVGFHGGINDNSDPKDIQEHELVIADGVSAHKVGKLVGIGNDDNALTNLNDKVANIEPGFGLYYFSTDFKDDDTNVPEDWLAIYDKANNLIKFYYSSKGGGTPNISTNNTLATGGAIKPNFYYAEDMLRVSDSSFSQLSKYFGYVESILYWTSNSGKAGAVHEINKWITGEQKLRTLETLLGDNIKLANLSSASPNTGTIGNGTKKLFLGYWTNKGGEWNGNYEFGVTAIYMGNQESNISTVNASPGVADVGQFYNNQVVFQVFIPMGTAATIADDAAHKLGDDRIIGLNWYFRQQGDNDWSYLMNTDLTEGGKHYWKVYNANTETTYGHWIGAEVTPSAGGSTQEVYEGIDIVKLSTTNNTHIAFTDNASDTDPGTWKGTVSSPNGNVDHTTQAGKSYHNVHLRVKLSNTNINGFDNRKGFLRVWGGAVSPIYVNTDSDGDEIKLLTGQGGTPGTTYDVFYIPMALPSLGTDREFKVEVLDENFSVIADSGIKTMTIEESNKVEPDDYEQEVE